jgi:hypothetical protein
MPRGAFPATFGEITTDDDQDDDIIDSYFTVEGKAVLQASLGSYAFTNKSGGNTSGPIFRLLKI